MCYKNRNRKSIWLKDLFMTLYALSQEPQESMKNKAAVGSTWNSQELSEFLADKLRDRLRSVYSRSANKLLR